MPGTTISAGRDGRFGASTRYSVEQARWVDGMLSLENASLADVVAAANHYSKTQIVLDPALASLRFTGAVRATDTCGAARMIACCSSFISDCVFDTRPC